MPPMKNVPRYLHQEKIIEIFENNLVQYNLQTDESQTNEYLAPLPSSPENAASIKFSNRIVIYKPNYLIALDMRDYGYFYLTQDLPAEL